MEERKAEKNLNKRARIESTSDSDSDSDSPVSKRVKTEAEANFNSPELKRVNTESEVSMNSPDSDEYLVLDSQIREDILDILDDPDLVTESAPEIQDLDSVMKSFEEQIIHPSPSDLLAHQTIIDLTSSDSGDSRLDLGYLLGASDDELGLPPAISSSDDHFYAEVDIPATVTGSDNMAMFENALPRYDSFDFGLIYGTDEGNNCNDDFVTVGGLFDNQELLEFSDLSWQAESLPAL